jgi:uncharacterized membrane protein YidH (DUF202 family)
MTSRLPSEPQRAHTTPSPPSSPPRTSIEDARPHKSAEDLLREEDDRIATELLELPPAHRRESRESSIHGGGDGDYTLRPELVRATTREQHEEEEAHRRLGFRFQRYQLVPARRRWWHPLSTWWNRHVSVKVDVSSRRDHLALERTFLGYLRTSLALSMTGVIIAQLFRLQRARSPSPAFGFFVSGEPLAACFIVSSIVVVLLGAFRFWRQQGAMVRGKVWAGGWEILAVMGVGMALCIALFAITVGVNVQHDVDGR